MAPLTLPHLAHTQAGALSGLHEACMSRSLAHIGMLTPMRAPCLLQGCMCCSHKNRPWLACISNIPYTNCTDNAICNMLRFYVERRTVKRERSLRQRLGRRMPSVHRWS